MAARKSAAVTDATSEAQADVPATAVEVPSRLVGFTPEQIRMLAEMLDSANVKKNPKGFDYIEAWHAMDVANRIFGFDGWDRETVTMATVEAPYKTKSSRGDDQYRLAYLSKVRITVRAGDRVVVREGTGYGSGIGKDLNDTHESASKEAESDATKRALMTFGYQFGLALYDKEKEFVLTAEMKRAEAEQAAFERSAEDLRAGILSDLSAIKKLDALGPLYDSYIESIKDVRKRDKGRGDALIAMFTAKKNEILVHLKETEKVESEEPRTTAAPAPESAAAPAEPSTEAEAPGFVLTWDDGHTRTFATVEEWAYGLERFLNPDGNYNQFHNFKPNAKMARELAAKAANEGNLELAGRFEKAVDTALKIHAEKTRAKAEA